MPHIVIVSAFVWLLPLGVLSQPTPSKPLSVKEAINAIDALTTYFECEECHPVQLIAVTRYGDAIIPSLAATLHGGLSPASRELMRRSLAARYEQLVRQGEKDPKFKISASEKEFVARHLEDFDARYRIRAAQALAALGGPQARAALEAALSKTARADVRTVVQQSLDKIN
jgi:hypothetical protein